MDTNYDFDFTGAAIFSGGDTTFVHLADNSILPWGSNDAGQFGLGKTGATEPGDIIRDRYTVDFRSSPPGGIVMADGGWGSGDVGGGDS